MINITLLALLGVLIAVAVVVSRLRAAVKDDSFLLDSRDGITLVDGSVNLTKMDATRGALRIRTKPCVSCQQSFTGKG